MFLRSVSFYNSHMAPYPRRRHYSNQWIFKGCLNKEMVSGTKVLNLCASLYPCWSPIHIRPPVCRAQILAYYSAKEIWDSTVVFWSLRRCNIRPPLLRSLFRQGAAQAPLPLTLLHILLRPYTLLHSLHFWLSTFVLFPSPSPCSRWKDWRLSFRESCNTGRNDERFISDTLLVLKYLCMTLMRKLVYQTGWIFKP
jgi:hypothetical protein